MSRADVACAMRILRGNTHTRKIVVGIVRFSAASSILVLMPAFRYASARRNVPRYCGSARVKSRPRGPHMYIRHFSPIEEECRDGSIKRTSCRGTNILGGSRNAYDAIATEYYGRIWPTAQDRPGSPKSARAIPARSSMSRSSNSRNAFIWDCTRE